MFGQTRKRRKYNEKGFLYLLEEILKRGVEVPDRTGVGTIAVFDDKLEFDTDVTFPMATIRPMPLWMAYEEFWFFLRGETQTKKLEDEGVKFWKPNTTRDFLDNRGLTHLDEGDMGKAYGYQFRNSGGNVDQLQNLWDGLKNDRYNRRNIIMLWNPIENSEMALTPCWFGSQYVVLPNRNGEDELHVKLWNRSLDTAFGAYFAIQQYALFQKALATALGIKVGKLSCDLTHVHIYKNQIDFVKEMLTRKQGTPGEVSFGKELNTLDDIVNLKREDILVSGAKINDKPFVTPKPPMAQ